MRMNFERPTSASDMSKKNTAWDSLTESRNLDYTGRRKMPIDSIGKYSQEYKYQRADSFFGDENKTPNKTPVSGLADMPLDKDLQEMPERGTYIEEPKRVSQEEAKRMLDEFSKKGNKLLQDLENAIKKSETDEQNNKI